MYSEVTGTRKTLGDVDVVFHNGIYHLFHLVLPNHDFIAHAVSDNCFQWRRVENALFLGDPGSWDDSMLWTIHVTSHPHHEGWWRMFYTGISRRDHGLKQRIGMAESENLYCWKKAAVRWQDRRSRLPYELPGRQPQPPFDFDPESDYPLEPDPRFYESEIDQGRNWVSFRDPFYYRENGDGFLLTAGRVKDGPITRRGCVAMMKETSPNHFDALPPLHHPGLYDDIEVPNLIKINDVYYLIGSMREDAKIRYWYTRNIKDPWRSFSDNVLLAAGNYAGRVCHDDRGILLWNFFTPSGLNRVTNNLMPPPKRLVQGDRGQLEVRTFEGFDDVDQGSCREATLSPLISSVAGEPTSVCDEFELDCQTGLQIYLFDQRIDDFRLSAELESLDDGKIGFVFGFDAATRDGYYLSLDLFKGVAQLRAWGSGPDGSGEEMMKFETLQSAYWVAEDRGVADLQLINFGSYIELSVGGRVMLSLADQTYDDGTIGFYVESGRLRITGLTIDHLQSPVQSDEQLANG